jgi:KDO2-lipid IV(A) lauroyltransferase
MIIFSGHVGNWEIGAIAAVQYGSTAAQSYNVTQIYRAPNNPLIDRLIAKFRGDRGEYIPKGITAARRAYAALYRGEHLTMLADQKLNEGIPVPFFGRPAMTATALALPCAAFRLRCAAGAGRAAAGRAFSSDGLPACAVTPQRKSKSRCRSADSHCHSDSRILDS